MDEELHRALVALASEYGRLAIYVFGSRLDEVATRVAGRPVTAAHPEADVDVGGELLLATDLDAAAEAQLCYRRRAEDLAPLLRERWHETVGRCRESIHGASDHCAAEVDPYRRPASRPRDPAVEEPGGVSKRCSRRGHRGVVLSPRSGGAAGPRASCSGRGLGERALEYEQIALALRRAGVQDEVRDAMLDWLRGHPELVDGEL